MEHGQEFNTNEEMQNNQNNKLDELTSLVHGLAQNFEKQEINTINNSIINRIESKLDILAQSTSSDYIDLFLSKLKEDIDDKQTYLDQKISYIEKLNGYIDELLKKSAKELTNENQFVNNGFNSLKTSIQELSSSFNNIKNDLNQLNEKINKTAEIEKTSGINEEELNLLLSEIRPLLTQQELQLNSAFEFLHEKLDLNKKLINELNQGNKELIESLFESGNTISHKIDGVSTSITEIDTKISSFYETMERLTHSSSNIGEVSNKIESLYNELINMPSNSREGVSNEHILEFKNTVNELKYSVALLSDVNEADNSENAKQLSYIIEKLNKLPEIFEVLMEVLKSNNIKNEIVEIKENLENSNKAQDTLFIINNLEI